MHKKLGMKRDMIKVELACTVDEDASLSILLIVLLVTLRSIYRKQAIVTTHKQSFKRIEEKISESFENQQMTLATEKKSNSTKIRWIWPYHKI